MTEKLFTGTLSIKPNKAKNKMDLINTKREKEGHRFLDAQEQLTLWSLIGSGRILNSSKLLCMSSLPASMKGILSR